MEEVQILGKIAQSLRHLHIFNIINVNLKMPPPFPARKAWIQEETPGLYFEKQFS